jgi:hypothetical protein
MSKKPRKRPGKPLVTYKGPPRIVPYPHKPGQFHILTPRPEFTKPAAEMTRKEAREAFNALFLWMVRNRPIMPMAED